MLLAIAAAVLCTAGAALELWAVVVLGWRQALDLKSGALDTERPRLVFAGPFRRVRHPQSAGLLLLLIGAAVAARSASMWSVACLAGGLTIAMAIRHDRELGREFGEIYARYRAAVPFLVPRLR
jgi:protein-S-isoprenylcysteine O-methyltransferase Ste14